MGNNSKRQQKVRVVIWECDKPDCGALNTRTIPINNVINEDVCDFCNQGIHEPLTLTKKDKA